MGCGSGGIGGVDTGVREGADGAVRAGGTRSTGTQAEGKGRARDSREQASSMVGAGGESGVEGRLDSCTGAGEAVAGLGADMGSEVRQGTGNGRC